MATLRSWFRNAARLWPALILGLLLDAAFAGAVGGAASAPSKGAEALKPSVDALLNACFDDYCGLDFSRSEAEARAAVALQPGQVLPLIYLQAELATQIQELSYAHADASGPIRRFKRATQAALVLEQAREGARHDSWAQLCLGNSLGVAGLVDMCEGHLWSAYREGKRADAALRLAQAREPGLADADLGLGEYRYYCGRMSAFLRGFLGLPGDVRGGIFLLETCGESASRRSATLARLTLARILTEEVPDFAKALSYVQEAEARYPGNWTSAKEALEEAQGLGLDRPEARALVESVAGQWDRGWRPPAYAGMDPGPARLGLARWYLSHGRRREARSHLRALERGAEPIASEARRLEAAVKAGSSPKAAR